jgi:hypothetical protein
LRHVIVPSHLPAIDRDLLPFVIKFVEAHPHLYRLNVRVDRVVTNEQLHPLHDLLIEHGGGDARWTGTSPLHCSNCGGYRFRAKSCGNTCQPCPFGHHDTLNNNRCQSCTTLMPCNYRSCSQFFHRPSS